MARNHQLLQFRGVGPFTRNGFIVAEVGDCDAVKGHRGGGGDKEGERRDGELVKNEQMQLPQIAPLDEIEDSWNDGSKGMPSAAASEGASAHICQSIQQLLEALYFRRHCVFEGKLEIESADVCGDVRGFGEQCARSAVTAFSTI